MAVVVAAVAWAVVGAWVALHTPMDAVPDLSENQVLVSADWPGQNPPDIERRITRPLSLALQSLPGVRAVRGSSDVGYALLHVIFDDAVSFAEARERVGAQLAGLTVELPPGVTARLAADGIPTGQIFWYTVEGTGTDLVELRTLQDTVIAPQLRSVPGVAEIASVGGFVPEYHVAVDLGRLAEAQVALADFATALRTCVEPATGHVLHSANTEFLVRMMPDASGPAQRTDWRHRLEAAVLPLPDGRRLPLAQFGRVALGTAPRRGVFEKDGSEAVAGIVHLRYGHNPLEVTRSVRQRLRQIADGLPATVRVLPCYDRTPLIEGAVGTVTRTLIESLLVTSLCVLVVLRHWRTSLVITLTLPLAVLGAFLGMWALRSAGLADVQTNIMSLAGIVVSIGVLVDSSIVVAENVTHQLRRRFGDQPVTGDVSDLVADACATVAVPAFFAVLIMVVSFLPVFALQGIDGRMYRPLAWTKTLALLSVAVLTVTLVPVLCSLLIRGRVRDESESAIVRSVVGVYRPVLTYLLRQPLPLAVLLGVTLIAAAAATGVDLLVRLTAVASIGVMWWLAARLGTKLALTALMVVVALTAQTSIRPIGLALRLPLDEGMIMDMPITVPRVSVTQALDDLKARNMVLCRFPEVQMVTGKAGRAETPFDPAPLDM
ncbi:MAG: efflux RND transporter permease subunit, partial [Planctomycetaceae bacterium]|nr:efflux RND transporter permease subunit [Planctomycetaceae bacterium]